MHLLQKSQISNSVPLANAQTQPTKMILLKNLSLWNPVEALVAWLRTKVLFHLRVKRALVNVHLSPVLYRLPKLPFRYLYQSGRLELLKRFQKSVVFPNLNKRKAKIKLTDRLHKGFNDPIKSIIHLTSLVMK